MYRPCWLAGSVSCLRRVVCWLTGSVSCLRRVVSWLAGSASWLRLKVYWLAKVAMVYWADWDNKKGLISGLRILIYWSANPVNWLRLSVCWLAFSISWLSPRASWLVKLIVGWSSSQPASWLVSCQPVCRKIWSFYWLIPSFLSKGSSQQIGQPSSAQEDITAILIGSKLIDR